MITRN